MKNIIKIFKSDINALAKNFFVLVIAIGLCALPALYAWFNIYANWDPYGNTGNIKIAVVNLDEGWTDDSGEYYNMGDDVVESLKEKDSIGWVFLNDRQKAIDGISGGKYYAGVVIDEKFTYSMYKGIMDTVDSPKITYYANDKRNAVATKITDTAVGTVKNSINEQYVASIVEILFEHTNEVSKDIEDEDVVDQFITKMTAVRDTLLDYDTMISSFIDANKSLSTATAEAGEAMKEGQNMMTEGKADLQTAQDNLDATSKSFSDFNKDVTDSLAAIETSLATISGELEEAAFDQDVATLTEDANAVIADANELSDSLTDLSAALSKIQKNDNLKSTINAIDNAQALVDTIAGDKTLDDKSGAVERSVKQIQKTLDSYTQTVKQIEKMYNKQISPQIQSIMDNMSDTLKNLESLLDTLNSTAGGMTDVFSGVGTTLDTMNMSLVQLQEIIQNSADSLTDNINKLQSASDTEAMGIIMNFLSADPETLGSFFSEPVKMETSYIYPIENYGSGVAPFYTTLAIWVGMTILVSLIKVHANTEDLPGVQLHELYFGRYLLFLLLSEIQTTIIVLGDILWLKIQCLYPFEFWLAASMASLTFSLIVYSLTISFGDVGKALAVVVMIIQIAGSGGTYPIEALPTFFQAVYIFFPFPYAINAMRECIGGMYENTFASCLSVLGMFCIGSLVIGLVVRIPVIHLNHFIEERMEDTKML